MLDPRQFVHIHHLHHRLWDRLLNPQMLDDNHGSLVQLRCLHKPRPIHTFSYDDSSSLTKSRSSHRPSSSNLPRLERNSKRGREDNWSNRLWERKGGGVVVMG
ncbi:hypothetical protein Droror1_Dr00006101 [Drosera rotundifolia]